jgi:hypothetical protein
MRAKPSSREPEERPKKRIINFSNRLADPLGDRYAELMRLRQTVLEAESKEINAAWTAGRRILR